MKTTLNDITRIFIPNRGEIACRLIEACKKLNITPILGFSAADRNSKAARLADEKICLGAAEARSSYLDIDLVISAALETRASAIHPGYGFLAENDQFSRACAKAKLIFIGPNADAMKQLGDKIEAKKIADKENVSTLAGFIIDATDALTGETNSKLKAYFKKNPFPLLVKAAAGGGGRGMRVIEHAQHAIEQIQSAAREAETFFKDGTVFIEPYIRGARHIEIQILADAYGTVKAIGSRDCSLQRRHQKIIEEAPACLLSAKQEKTLFDAAERIVSSVNYQGLATVEFLVNDQQQHYFLEVNTRLQVEHPVSEISLGIDLVAIQIDIARGKALESLLGDMRKKPLFAIEARICAEKPEADFQTSSGMIRALQFPSAANIRIDSGFEVFDSVSHYYDSLIAKIITSGKTRSEGITTLQSAIQETIIAPLATNLAALAALLGDTSFVNNTHSLLTTAQVLTPISNCYEEQLPLALIAAALIKTTAPKSASHWDMLGSWATSGSIRSLLHMRIDQTLWQLSLEKIDGQVFVSFNSAGVEVTAGCCSNIQLTEVDREFSFLFNGKKIHGSFTAPSNELTVIKIGLGLINVEFIAPPKFRKQSLSNSAENYTVLAHLPGKVVKVHARVGADISERTPLVVIESMKMEHTVVAEKAGVVLQQMCILNGLVNSGDALYIIGPESEKAKK